MGHPTTDSRYPRRACRSLLGAAKRHTLIELERHRCAVLGAFPRELAKALAIMAASSGQSRQGIEVQLHRSKWCEDVHRSEG